jgi:hypothetical protein
MNCPKCNAVLARVNVYSQCVQRAEVGEDGQITDYGPVDEVLETQGIECPECAEDLRDIVTEG